MPQDKLDILIYLVSFLILLNLFSLFATYLRASSTGVNTLEAINYYLAKGDFKTALSLCKKLSKKRPHDSNVMLITAITHFRAGKNQDAKSLFKELIIKDPQFKTEADQYLEILNSET